MKLRHNNICSLVVLLYFFSFAAIASDDTRILIDVSGSMKVTDPDNLRVPALKLLNGLLPTGSKAGVWYFGKYVDMSVRWGTVDKAWRKSADKGAANLHSNGLFTNIESALDRAVRGWDKEDPKSARNIILLTDGQVDISKDPEINKKSHARILSKGIDKLKKSGARVFSIALSKNTDEVLLKQLAQQTGGFFERVDSADALKKVFFKMFEKAVSPDSIELDGNQFTVDKSVKELTLLIFKKANAAPVNIYPPQKDTLTALQPGSAKWISDPDYELITIEKPVPGVWTLEAETDENTRLMVVTDLKLKTRGLPRFAMPSDELAFVAELFNRDKMIKKNSFLRFVDFNFTHINPQGVSVSNKIDPAAGHKNKGEYPVQLNAPLEEGNHEFVVTAETKTFNRSQRIHLQIQWPAIVDLSPGKALGDFNLTISPRLEILKPETFVPKVSVIAPDKSEHVIELIQTENQWSAVVSTNQSGMYQAMVGFKGEDIDGNAININQGAYSMLGVFKENISDTSDQEASNQNNPDKDPDSVETMEDEEELSIDWLKVGLIVGGVNLLFAIIGGAFYFVARRRKKSDFSLFDEASSGENEAALLEESDSS